MPRRVFRTLSIDLVEYAEAVANDFERRGFTIRVEKSELGFPYTPTILCIRRPTTVIVEVISQIQQDRLDAWVSYARSSGRDTRVAVCISDTVAISPDQGPKLRQDGIGLYTSNGHTIEERIAPMDLGLNVTLPPLESLPQKVRTLLGPAYEQFGRTQWREGFEDACKALENEARRYLKAGSRMGRIRIDTGRRLRILTDKEINKMTIGALANAFSEIQSQNHSAASSRNQKQRWPANEG